MNIRSEQALEQFVIYIQLEKNFSPLTVREYQSDLHEFLSFLKVEGVVDLADVEYIHARLYVTKLYEEKSENNYLKEDFLNPFFFSFFE